MIRLDRHPLVSAFIYRVGIFVFFLGMGCGLLTRDTRTSLTPQILSLQSFSGALSRLLTMRG